MTFRIVSVHGKRGRLSWSSSLASAMDEVEDRGAELKTPADYVRLSLDTDDVPIVEMRDG